MSVYARCLKCGQKLVFYKEFLFKKGLKNGCPCGSKNIKGTGDEGEEVKINFITDECLKCHRTKITDITNGEEIKGDVIKKVGGANKKMSIKSANKELEETCYCSSIIFSGKSPWVIGGGLVGLGLIIGLVVYLIKKKKQS